MFPIIKTISYVRKYNTQIIQNAIKNKNKKNKKPIKRGFSSKKDDISFYKIPPNPNNYENFWIYYLLGISFWVSMNSMIKKHKKL